MQRKDKDTVTRNLDDTFRLEDDGCEDEEQLTPAEALVAAKTYLHCAQTGEKEEAHQNTARALKLMSDALAASAPKKAHAKRRTREKSPGGDPSSPDDDDDDDDHRRNHPGRKSDHDQDNRRNQRCDDQ